MTRTDLLTDGPDLIFGLWAACGEEREKEREAWDQRRRTFFSYPPEHENFSFSDDAAMATGVVDGETCDVIKSGGEF